MKLNNKGFAISSIMYIILVLAVVLIFLTLAILSSRKLILDKLKIDVYDDIYERPSISYRTVLNTLKEEVISYANENSLEKESVKIEDVKSSIDGDTLKKYDLSNKYLTIINNSSNYDVYLGKSKTVTNTKDKINNLLDIIDYKIYGNTYQETRDSSINLINHYDVVETASTPGVLNGAVINEEYIDIVRRSQYDYATIPVSLKAGKTYTLWYECKVYDRKSDDTTKTTAIGLGFAATALQQKQVKENGTYYEVFNYTPTEDIDTKVRIYANYGSTVPAKVRFRVMVVEGKYTLKTIPEYQPYGEKPSPEIPSEVVSVGNKPKILNNTSTNTFNYYINGSGQPTQDNISSYTQLIPVSPNTSYTIKSDVNVQANYVQRKRLHAYDKDGNWIGEIFNIPYEANETGYKEMTGTTPSNCAYVRISHIPQNEKYLYLVEAGQTEKYTVPIRVHSKNLININAINSSSYTINDSNISVKVISLNSSTSTGLTLKELCPSLVSGETYTISYESDNNSHISLGSYSEANFWNNGESRTITNEDLNEVVRMGNSTGVDETRIIEFSNIQVEKGKEKTEYAPYQSIITNIYIDEPLRKVGNSSDYMNFGNSEIVRYLAHIEFTGNENWMSRWQRNNTFSISIPDAYEETSYTSIFKGFSNYYKTVTHGNIYSTTSEKNGISNVVTTPNITIRDIGVTSLSEFIQKLADKYNSGKPVTVDYLMSAPKTTKTNLSKIVVLEGATNISIDTSLAPSKFEFTVIEKLIKI